MGKKYVEAFGDAQLWPWPILQVGWIIMSFAGETQSACTKQCWGKKGWCLAGRCLGMDGWMDGWMDARTVWQLPGAVRLLLVTSVLLRPPFPF